MVLGLAAPTSGRALAFDHPYAELPRPALRIGAVLEATVSIPAARAVTTCGCSARPSMSRAHVRTRCCCDYGCIAEPGRGWIMPKVLPSVSLA